MKRILLLLMLLLTLSTSAFAQGIDCFAQIDQQIWQFVLDKGADGAYGATGLTFSNGSGSLMVDISTDIDPTIAFTLTATNMTATPITFGFFIPGLPIAPIFNAKVAASISGGLTDTTGDGVGVAPAAFDGLPLSPFILTNFTLPQGTAWGAGNPLFVPGTGPLQSPDYPQFAVGGLIPGLHSVFGELVAFSLTGNSDIASLTGKCSIAAPLPSGVLLMGSGLLALVGLRRQK
jgi:hypothetical protein